MSANDFRDHWGATEPEWSRGGTWLTSFVLPPKVVGATVASVAGHMDLPFLAPVPTAGMHITVQRVSRLPDPIQQELPRLLEVAKVSSLTSMPSMQRSPNRLSDPAVCTSM